VTRPSSARTARPLRVHFVSNANNDMHRKVGAPLAGALRCTALDALLPRRAHLVCAPTPLFVVDRWLTCSIGCIASKAGASRMRPYTIVDRRSLVDVWHWIHCFQHLLDTCVILQSRSHVRPGLCRGVSMRRSRAFDHICLAGPVHYLQPGL
jgi:hypothetical protein